MGNRSEPSVSKDTVYVLWGIGVTAVFAMLPECIPPTLRWGCIGLAILLIVWATRQFLLNREAERLRDHIRSGLLGWQGDFYDLWRELQGQADPSTRQPRERLIESCAEWLRQRFGERLVERFLGSPNENTMRPDPVHRGLTHDVLYIYSDWLRRLHEEFIAGRATVLPSFRLGSNT